MIGLDNRCFGPYRTIFTLSEKKPMPFEKSLTYEQECAIVRRYYTCQNLTQIAEEFGTSQQTVSRVLDAAGARTTRVRTTDDAAVAEACKSGKTRAQIAEMFGISRETVSRVARDYKIVMQTGRPRTKTIRDDAFDTITPESAYWSGMLFSDGAVIHDEHGQPRIAMNLSEVDRGHIEKFRAFLGSDHAIGHMAPGRSTFSKEGFASFKVRSAQLASALCKFGMVPIKAERVPCPELAESRDFWRGMIDGDGTIGIHVTNGYAIVQLAGQRAVLEPFAAFLNKNFGLSTTVCVKAHAGHNGRKNDLHHVQTTGPNAMRVVSVLYENACVSLDRKFQTACEILKHARS